MATHSISWLELWRRSARRYFIDTKPETLRHTRADLFWMHLADSERSASLPDQLSEEQPQARSSRISDVGAKGEDLRSGDGDGDRRLGRPSKIDGCGIE